jgi:hypothetical protein
VKIQSPTPPREPVRPRRTARPGTRTRIDDSTDVEGIPSAGTRARNRSNRTARGDWMSISRPHPSASVAHRDAPLIDERAATRRRTATEGGDSHAGARQALSVEWLRRIDARELQSERPQRTTRPGTRKAVDEMGVNRSSASLANRIKRREPRRIGDSRSWCPPSFCAFPNPKNNDMIGRTRNDCCCRRGQPNRGRGYDPSVMRFQGISES